MDINTALGKLTRDQAESGDVKTSADDLAALSHRLSDVSTREIEKLIDELQALRKQQPTHAEIRLVLSQTALEELKSDIQT